MVAYRCDVTPQTLEEFAVPGVPEFLCRMLVTIKDNGPGGLTVLLSHPALAMRVPSGENCTWFTLFW
jgi:hypothetical protein